MILSYNNTNGRLSTKRLGQQLAMDFFDEPAKSLRLEQEGIYTSYEFGPEGKEDKNHYAE